jgi:polar amino acid transport system substrate-binding protein
MYKTAKEFQFVILASLALLLAGNRPLIAGETKTYIIGVQNFQEYLPYSEYKNNTYTGFNRKVLDLFADAMNYKFIYRPIPLKRLYKEFVELRVDLKYPDNAYWSKDIKKNSNVHYSDPLVQYIDGAMVHPQNKGKGIAKVKKLGVVGGFTPFAYLKFIKNGEIEVKEVFDYKNLLKLTIHRRLDGAYSNICVSKYYLRSLFKESDALVFDPDLPHTKSTRHLSSIKYPQIIKEFNSFLKKNEKVVNALKKKYSVEEELIIEKTEDKKVHKKKADK